jgi:tetratricopeptide (TPR) repeat protein
MARIGVACGIAFCAAVGIWIAAALAAVEPADDREICAQAPGAAAIAACTRAVTSGRFRGPTFAALLYKGRFDDRRRSLLDSPVAPDSASIRLQPQLTIAYNGANALYGKKDYAAAIGAFTEVIRLDPKNTDAFYNRAMARRANGDDYRAIADLSETIRLDPILPDAFYNRGVGYFGLGYFVEAAEDLRRTNDLTDDAYATLWRFLARGRLGQNGAAELSAAAARLPAADGPYPVIDFYLGRRPLADMHGAAETPRQKCEAALYAGVWLAWRSTAETARPALQRAADTCPKTSTEYAAAVAELKRL